MGLLDKVIVKFSELVAYLWDNMIDAIRKFTVGVLCWIIVAYVAGLIVGAVV